MELNLFDENQQPLTNKLSICNTNTIHHNVLDSLSSGKSQRNKEKKTESIEHTQTHSIWYLIAL